jgi:hypothetical protein
MVTTFEYGIDEPYRTRIINIVCESLTRCGLNSLICHVTPDPPIAPNNEEIADNCKLRFSRNPTDDNSLYLSIIRTDLVNENREIKIQSIVDSLRLHFL